MLKRRIINWLLKSLFNAVTENDILTSKGGQVFRGKKALNTFEAEELINGAQALQNMGIWKQLRDEMKWVANDRIYNKSVTTDDLIFPKAVLYTLDVMQSKISNLAKLKWTELLVVLWGKDLQNYDQRHYKKGICWRR